MQTYSTSLKSTPAFEALLGHGAHYAGTTVMKKYLLAKFVVGFFILLHYYVVRVLLAIV